MKDKTVLLYLIIGLLLFGILVAIAYQIRQDIYRTDFANQVQAHRDQVARLEKSSSYMSLSFKSNSQNTQAEPNNVATKQSLLLKQQQQLYLDFAQIISALGQGQQPDPRQVSLLVSLQQTLVEAKLVTRDEAKAQIEFLLKVLPEMDHELHRALRTLEQIRS
ncbi:MULTISPECIES: hypothetical protein [Acinetobacter]|uniref:Uncharacterized protein n=1 Tax=Acinetobacter pseudolwoffii TaxID=2053287 RepID=N9KQ94_9GAMM|nr:MULTISPECIES: hypothetical protein [Acinetobacter]ENW86247.1 hypothetical protein F906_01301 [Acinetobacter pseudolwoffii]MCP0910508.1 hypothetical protein [Acinetobacter pseudolwoffii]MDH5819099.1 hypothetical protein [Acinetobacter pseudolwoffii]PJI36142.1 hypothetical protein CU318_00935 [Acinetobacter pseudolwoffii]QPF30990.1 hypothetical protein H0S56_07765 [Acinetobacter lwoffii]